MALCDISQTLERLRVTDFSHPVYVDELAFMSHSPNVRSRDWLVASPFNWRVWLCIFLALALVCSVLRSVLWCKSTRKDKSHSVMSIAVKLYAIWMGQCKYECVHSRA